MKGNFFFACRGSENNPSLTRYNKNIQLSLLSVALMNMRLYISQIIAILSIENPDFSPTLFF